MADSLSVLQLSAGSTGSGYRVTAIGGAMIAMGVYLLTIAPDITWANAALDGPELITASATLGVSHPPGYPTYIVLGKFFSFLPIGTVAFRYNLFSAVTTASAVGLLILVIGKLHSEVRPVAALSTALLFAFAPLVWSQAIVAEIYSLNLLMVAAFLYVWSCKGSSRWSGLCLGLAITTHLSSIFLLPGFIFSSRRHLARPVTGVILGLSPLLLLPLLARGYSPIVWGQPTDLVGWLWVVTGRLYAGNIQPAIEFNAVKGLFKAILLGLAMVAQIRALPEINPLHEAQVSTDSSRPTQSVLALTAILYVGFVLVYNVPDSAILLLPVFLLLTIMVAPLLNRLGKLALLLPVILVLLTFQSRNMSQVSEARTLATGIFSVAPQNALLLTPGDRTIFTLYYFQYVEGIRPDLRVVDTNLFAFDWYRNRLTLLYPDIIVPEQDDLYALQVENGVLRPVCQASLINPLKQNHGGGISLDKYSQTPPYIICQEGEF